jgi:protein-glutamine gamma-glutamyltransferase
MTGTARALALATYLLVLDGLAALWLGGLLGSLGLGLVGLAVAASVWRERLLAPLAQVRGGDTLPALVAAAAALVDLLYIAESVLDGLVHLLLFLLLYRLFTRRSLRDVRDIGFLCFFMLVAAAPGALDVGFLFVFVGFLVAGTWMLMLRHVLVESSGAVTATVTGAGTVAPGRLLTLSVVAAVATLGIAVALFFALPRIGQATLPMRANVTRMVAGFSERVTLGSFGEIETDASVVMRVHVSGGTASPRLYALRWRGITLDHFDGAVWTRGDLDRATLRRFAGGTFELARPRGTGAVLRQEIYLEPLGTPVLFAAPRVLRLGLRTDAVTVGADDSVSVASPAARLRYTVDSELEPPVVPGAGARHDVLDGAARARYLQLPSIAPRVRALAEEVAGGAPDAATAASRLASFLAGRYRYTRVLARSTSLPPVEEFLFVSRAGNCEYFAAALAVMLRARGIPARVVNGFQRGEWNPYGGYFMVRLLDAHSWVEAHLDGAGWVTLDPSPRDAGDAASAPGPVNLYLDALRLRWYRYVVNWSLQDQIGAAEKVRDATTTWTPAIGWLGRRDHVRPVAVSLAVVLAGSAVVLLVWRRASVAAAARRRDAPPRFYLRTLRILARRGFRPEPVETAREFAARVAAAAPEVAVPLARLTGGYERARFGDAAPTVEELREFDECIVALASPRA